MQKFGPICWAFAGVLAMILAGSFTIPARAKIRCDDTHATHAACAQEFAAQRRARIVIHPRYRRLSPYAKRYCRFWLARELRVSGPVITPQQHCWWYVPRR